MEKNKKKFIIVGILLTLLVMIGTSYAWWTSTAIQSGINEIQSDCLDLKIQNESDAITLQNAYPLTDEEAKKLEPYKFTIKNNCNTSVNYTVKLEKLQKENEDVLNSNLIAVEFNNGQKQILSNYPDSTTQEIDGYTAVEARDLIKGTLSGNQEREYQIKLWMDEHVTLQDDATNKSFRSKIVVEGGMNDIAEYTEPILHGADPVLEGSSKPVAMLTANEVAEEPTTTDKLIPVIISDDGTVTKANTKQEWYNYEDKKWANAVILIDSAKEYKDGETIPEDQIESYFVWIPKYKYKIFDMGNYESLQEGEELTSKAKAIEIEFDIEDTQDNKEGECASPNQSGEDGQCAVDKWMTHPAFTAFPNSHGMWAGKFETGYKQDGEQTNWNQAGAQIDKNDSTKVIIKPNVYAWRYISLGNAYHASYEYQRELDSHMMKNTEWGAVAYLSHSKYGTCSGEACTEVRINNSSNFVTGVSAINAPTTGYNAYNDNGVTTPSLDNAKSLTYPKSGIASTTLNNTGIFDMSGGSWEYTMGYIDGQVGDSGLTKDNELKDENKKYFDRYLNSDVSNMNAYNHRILGDATGEMGPFAIKTYNTGRDYASSWYEDDSMFFGYATRYWFMRSGSSDYGTRSGLFCFHSMTGAAGGVSFRIVLIP